MKAPWTPMRWPAAWTDAAGLDLLTCAGIASLVIERSAGLDAVRARASQTGLQVIDPAAPPQTGRILKGEWPGVRPQPGGSAGPTGVAWVDSNGWIVQLSAALHPDAAAWIDAAPGRMVFPGSY